jgi:uncharacterized membrane protein
MADAAADHEEEDSPLQEVVGGLVTAFTLLAAFGSLALGVDLWWAFFIVGFAGVMPVAVGLTRLYESRQQAESPVASPPAGADEEALATLRRRYAAGEIDEVEFEHRVERLIETESVADAREYVDRVRAEVDASAPATREAERHESGERAAETDRER